MPSLSPDSFQRRVRRVLVAPGTKFLVPELKTIPAIVISDLVGVKVQRHDGTMETLYRPVERVNDAFIRISEAESLTGVSGEVLRKLIKGGFVEGCKVGPNNAMINIQDLHRHIEECLADFNFWAREDRRAHYDNGVLDEDKDVINDQKMEAAQS